MLKRTLLLAAMALTVPARAMTTTGPTLFNPTDGDVNVAVFTSAFGSPPAAWQLGLFDDDIISGGSPVFSGAPYLPLEPSGDVADFTAGNPVTNNNGDSLNLAGGQTFFLALDSGSGWSLPDTVICYSGASSCNLGWSGTGFALVADVTPVPLPAALPLLLGALFGLGAIRRRAA